MESTSFLTPLPPPPCFLICGKIALLSSTVCLRCGILHNSNVDICSARLRIFFFLMGFDDLIKKPRRSSNPTRKLTRPFFFCRPLAELVFSSRKTYQCLRFSPRQSSSSHSVNKRQVDQFSFEPQMTFLRKN